MCFGLLHTAVSRKSCLLDWGFGCFRDIERNSTNKCSHAFSFLVAKHRELQSSNAKLFLPIMPIDIVANAFTLLRDNLCRNSCMVLFHWYANRDPNDKPVVTSFNIYSVMAQHLKAWSIFDWLLVAGLKVDQTYRDFLEVLHRHPVVASLAKLQHRERSIFSHCMPWLHSVSDNI